MAPADAWLDEAEASVSQGVRELTCRLNQGSTSFEKTAENLARAAHLEVSAETARQLVESEGQRVRAALQGGTLKPDWTAAECKAPEGVSRIYLGCDGVKVPLVTDAEKRKRRQTIHRKRQLRGRKAKPLPRLKAGADQAYKEFRVVTWYDETQKHRYTVATSGNHEATGRLMRRTACQIGTAGAEERVANIDGAPWIRNQIELHGVVEAIGLDFYHLRENVQKARRSVFGEEAPEGTAWADETMHCFRHEGYARGWEELAAWRKTLRHPARRRAADRLLQYVTERREMIRYPEFRRRGWQIGSGPTEAQCKTTTHRVKGRGRRWDADHAEDMMALACLESSRLWDAYWKTCGCATT